jgi:hypothetical protein
MTASLCKKSYSTLPKSKLFGGALGVLFMTLMMLFGFRSSAPITGSPDGGRIAAWRG